MTTPNLPPPPAAKAATPASKPATMSVMPPPASLPPPPGSRAVSTKTTKDFKLSKGRIQGPQRVLIFGPGGVGKSSLARQAPNPVFLDVEDGTKDLDVSRYGSDQIQTFSDLRLIAASELLDPYGSVILDTSTTAQGMAEIEVVETIPHENGDRVDRLEGYGWNKGLAHVYELFIPLLQDFDRLIHRGKNVIIIAHDCVTDVPNPHGEDWIRYEPRLQSPKSGKNSIRNKLIEWCDHVLFVGYDVNVNKEGKGKGAGTRTIWTTARPTHVAKVRGKEERGIPDSLPYRNNSDGTIWNLILSGNKQ